MVKVIPAKWQEKTIGDIADFQGGSQPPLETFSNLKKEGYVRLIQIRDYKTDKYKTYIPQQLAKRFCSKDDIMIGRYGPPIFQILKGLDGAYNVALIKVIPKNIDKDFLYYTLSRKDLFEYIDQLSQRSSGQTGVDLEKLKEFDIVVPPLQEQRKIAIFLLDIDALISKFEQLVKKYQALKQACLQHMFPREGQTEPDVRLPGFADPWEQRKISDIAEVVGGGTPSTAIPDYWDGDIDWYAPAEIGEQIFVNGSIRKITEKGLKNSSAKLLPAEKTVLFTSRAGIGNMAILQRPGTTNQGFQSLVCHDDIEPYFVFSMGKTIKQQAERVASGSTFTEISGKKLGELKFMFPKQAEQKKIGAFFATFDRTITLHQRACEKYKKIKQGMMEELLSGKIRLV